MAEVPEIAGYEPAGLDLADEGVAPEQLTLRQVTFQRYRRHPIALWATLVLILIAVGCYAAPLWHALWPRYIQAPQDFDLTQANQPPSLSHLMGTDSLNGHDIFSLILYGGRVSLLIGIGSMVVAVVIAIVLGAAAGYHGGFVDAALMRGTDIAYAIPLLISVPLATRVFGQAHPLTIAFIFGLFSWPGPARIVRSMFLSLREAQFAEAARALGLPTWRIIGRHLLPNAVGPILVAFTLGIGNNIVLEAFVSYLGFGVQPPTYSWGSVMSDAQEYMLQGNWWWITFPGLAVVLTVLCINFIGDGLRDALDPMALQ